MAKEPRANRIPIMFSDAELQMIDDWRYGNRISTRADAVRRLCQMGIRSYGRLDFIAETIAEAGLRFHDVMAVLSNIDHDQKSPEEHSKIFEDAIFGIFIPVIDVLEETNSLIEELEVITETKKAKDGASHADRERAKRAAEYLAFFSAGGRDREASEKEFRELFPRKEIEE